MVYNTENSASPEKLPDKSQILERRYHYGWKLRKRKNHSSKLARVLSTIRVGRARAVKEMFMRELTKDDISGYTGTIPK